MIEIYFSLMLLGFWSSVLLFCMGAFSIMTFNFIKYILGGIIKNEYKE